MTWRKTVSDATEGFDWSNARRTHVQSALFLFWEMPRSTTPRPIPRQYWSFFPFNFAEFTIPRYSAYPVIVRVFFHLFVALTASASNSELLERLRRPATRWHHLDRNRCTNEYGSCSGNSGYSSIYSINPYYNFSPSSFRILLRLRLTSLHFSKCTGQQQTICSDCTRQIDETSLHWKIFHPSEMSERARLILIVISSKLETWVMLSPRRKYHHQRITIAHFGIFIF